MTPPSAVVVPQMMVGIVAIRSQGQVFCAHTVRDVGASRCQKSRFPKGIGKAAEISREFVSKRVGFAHYLKTSVFRWGTLAFSSPGCQTLSPTESFLMLPTSCRPRHWNSTTFCVIELDAGFYERAEQVDQGHLPVPAGSQGLAIGRPKRSNSCTGCRSVFFLRSYMEQSAPKPPDSAGLSQTLLLHLTSGS